MVLVPLKDENPLRRIGFPYVSVALIALCVVTFLWQTGLGAQQTRAIYALGVVPAVLLGERVLPPQVALVPAELTLVTSMFLHGSWLHLGGNMLFLWIFGDNIEDAMGHLRFLAFYLLCGVLAALAQVAASPLSEVPMVGASGAIAGVLGAYLVLHPRAQILMLFLRFFVNLPAFLVLGLWIGIQLVSAYFDSGGKADGGVAWWAHIGGFAAGMLLVVVFRRRGVPLFERDGGRRLPPRVMIGRLRQGSVPATRRRRF